MTKVLNKSTRTFTTPAGVIKPGESLKMSEAEANRHIGLYPDELEKIGGGKDDDGEGAGAFHNPAMMV